MNSPFASTRKVFRRSPTRSFSSGIWVIAANQAMNSDPSDSRKGYYRTSTAT